MKKELSKIFELRHAYIYLTNDCNLQCKHCWISSGESNASVKQINADLYKRFLDQAKGLGLKSVSFSGGEPLIKKKILFMLFDYCHKLGINISLETNGTLIDKNCVKKIKQYKISISISLDGSTAELHEKQRGVRGCFHKALNSIKMLTEEKHPITVIMAISKDNVSDIQKMLKLLETYKMDNKITLKINPITNAGRAKQNYNDKFLDCIDLLSLAKKVEKNYSNKFKVPILVHLEPAFHSIQFIQKCLVAGGRCFFHKILSVLGNGDISFCGMGYVNKNYVFGNINDSDFDLDKIWKHNPILLKMRTEYPSQLKGVCQKCIFKSYCRGGCRAEVLNSGGTFTDPAFRCQTLYEQDNFPQSRLI